MQEFLTYTTATNYVPMALTRPEYESGMLPNNWEDFVWQEAESKAQAIEQHDTKLDLYMGWDNA